MASRVLTTQELEALERLSELLELADVNDRQRFEFRAYPILAVELLEYALARKKIRNPAAFALSRFRVRVLGGLQELEQHEDGEPVELDRQELENGLELARKWNAPAAVIAALERELAERAA